MNPVLRDTPTNHFQQLKRLVEFAEKLIGSGFMLDDDRTSLPEGVHFFLGEYAICDRSFMERPHCKPEEPSTCTCRRGIIAYKRDCPVHALTYHQPTPPYEVPPQPKEPVQFCPIHGAQGCTCDT